MKITWREILIVSLFLFIILGITWTGCNKINSYKQEIAKQEQNIIALKDTVKLINGIWEELTVESNLKLLDISNVNDSLKEYVEQLKDEKKLLAATKIKITVRDTITNTIIKEVESDKPEYTQFYVEGSEGNLDYAQNIYVKDSFAMTELTYKYNLAVAFKYNRLQDGSIKASYAFDDPNVVVTEANSFYIPAEKPKNTKFKKALKWSAVIISTGITTYAGYSIGKNLSK